MPLETTMNSTHTPHTTHHTYMNKPTTTLRLEDHQDHPWLHYGFLRERQWNLFGDKPWWEMQLRFQGIELMAAGYPPALQANGAHACS